jgi:hypothetical protein
MIMRFVDFIDESQRDSGSKPRVARNEPPWESWAKANNPNGVEARLRGSDATPLGLKRTPTTTQGSSFLATLGWKTQSLWDCRNAVFQSFRAALSSSENF